MKTKLDHYWNASVPVDATVDATNIPGLQSDGAFVRGPVDAVSVYLKRSGRPPLSVPTPAPMAPPRGLRDFQVHGVEWILQRWAHVGSCILADEMGLGKTAQTIVAATHGTYPNRYLVVCPRSVALTWVAELQKWGGTQAVSLIRTGAEASKEEDGPHPWTIISYELLAALPPIMFGTVIIDEAHNFAGRTAKRGKVLQQICNLASRRIALTGTPIWSRPRDYWMLFKCLFGSSFGSAWDFDHAYCDATPGEHGGLKNSGVSRASELKHRVSFYQLRRLKSEVGGEMPKMTRSVRWVDPTPAATSAMKGALLHRRKGAAQRALAATLVAKMPAAMDAARDAQQFLLFTWQKKHAQFMQQELEKSGTPCHLLTGDVSPKQRAALIALAAKKKHGIVATLDVAGTGVDGLQHVASTGIIHALDFVPLKLLQGEKRLDRIGQKNPIQWIYILMKESMDVWVNQTVVEKLDQWVGLMGRDEAGILSDGLKGRASNQTDEELERQVMREIYRSAK